MLYDTLYYKIEGIVDGQDETNKKFQDICDLLRKHVPHFNWVGFYFVEQSKRELVLGPYSGEPTEHIRIAYGRGICGQAAERRETFVVQNVSTESNYLSCSPNVKSEIVIPVFKGEEVVGELDIDSHVSEPFTEEDKEFLENVCGLVSKLF